LDFFDLRDEVFFNFLDFRLPPAVCVGVGVGDGVGDGDGDDVLVTALLALVAALEIAWLALAPTSLAL
jgi:hypothetical protein